MERIIYDTKYSKIEIVSEIDGLIEIIKPYIYSYGSLRYKNNDDCNIDAKIYIFKRDLNSNKELIINKEMHEIGVNVNDLELESQLFIKRLLINLNNRILENKGMIFLHASSVCYENSGIIFIGDRGNGKTTNMLYMLENENTMYVSNDRTGLIVDENSKRVMMVGVPSRVNVRPGTIENNKMLKGKLLSILDNKEYEKKLKYRRQVDSMESRMIISIQELKEKLGIKERACCELKSIIVLEYNPEVEFQMEELTEEEIITILEKQRIDGVFSGTKEIENVINVQKRRIQDILKKQNIVFLRVTQNCNNSKRILRYLYERKDELNNER